MHKELTGKNTEWKRENNGSRHEFEREALKQKRDDLERK